VLEVVDPGLLLTLQDRGRPGWAHLGIPVSGAADTWGLAVANLLAGGPVDAAAVEVTLGGAELLVREACLVSLGGADLGAERDDGVPLAGGVAHRLPAGSRIRFAGTRSGLRAYLALAGGIEAGRVLGSVSTYATAGLGGVDGRALRAGDVLTPVRRGDLAGAGLSWPAEALPHPATGTGPILFVAGPDLRRLAADVVDAFTAATWRIGPAGDRMGLRLEGPPLAAGVEIVSHALVPGAIQLPSGGQPLVLLVDGPTVGGYPVLGVVTRAEMPRLGQLRPGDVIRFLAQEPDRARAAWRAQQAGLARAAEVLAADTLWHRLADHAGG
jgi:antagonist of KipI